MFPLEKALGIIVYAPALKGEAERTLAVVHGMERALPSQRLGGTISDGKFAPLPQRDEWIAQAAAHLKLPILCNGDEDSFVTVSGWNRPAGISSGGQPLFEIHAELPLGASFIAVTMDVLEGVAEGAHAHWGHASPTDIGSELARQRRRSANDPDFSPRGLPSIKLPEHIPSPEIPHYLGWFNYWSAAAARVIGFPDPSRDAELLSRARQTSTGGWIVQLTDAPLDFDNPAHLDMLKRTYARFPLIGGRSVP